MHHDYAEGRSSRPEPRDPGSPNPRINQRIWGAKVPADIEQTNREAKYQGLYYWHRDSRPNGAIQTTKDHPADTERNPSKMLTQLIALAPKPVITMQGHVNHMKFHTSATIQAARYIRMELAIY